MGEANLQVTVDVSFKDDNFIFYILASEGLTMDEIRSILVGGVCLTIHGEKTPKEQANALKEVMDYMEQDFVDIDSFKNIKIKRSKK